MPPRITPGWSHAHATCSPCRQGTQGAAQLHFVSLQKLGLVFCAPCWLHEGLVSLTEARRFLLYGDKHNIRTQKGLGSAPPALVLLARTQAHHPAQHQGKALSDPGLPSNFPRTSLYFLPVKDCRDNPEAALLQGGTEFNYMLFYFISLSFFLNLVIAANFVYS